MESHSNFPWALLFNFSVLLVGAVFLLRKSISGGLVERHDVYKNKIREAEELRVSAESLLANYESKLKNLDQEVDAIFQDAKMSAEKEKSQILLRAEESASKIVAQAKVLAEQQLLGLQKNIQGELSAQAIEDARRKLAAANSLENHEAFFDSFFTNAKVMHG